MSAKGRVARCAIYTRKSSEEGLDQAFNSLDAQREACEAYILSQAGEGWAAHKDRYDDGGFSGGTIERPALKRLLTDIADGKVDTVVVYKIDRLTRSLNDFAKIVDVLDRAGASFVSVTQAFNTTTSMGRLTLNVLLSFAQFEREVTGERIRDKIAASKAKGMWIGGVPPLGYDLPTDEATRRLVVNDGEADIVRQIFSRYLEFESVNRLECWLHDEGIRSKAWVSSRGRAMGGRRFSRGALFHLLKNRIYLGDIRHKDVTYPNAHPAVVDAHMFKAVQNLLAENASAARTLTPRGGRAVLTGLIFDAEGRPMSPAFSYGRSKRAYRYYVSAPLQKGGAVDDDDTLCRVPGQIVDDLLLDAIGRLARRVVSADEVGKVLRRVELHPDSVRLLLVRQALVGQARDAQSDLQLIERRLSPGERLSMAPSDQALVQVVLPLRVKARGGRTWMALPDGRSSLARITVDPVLVDGLSRAHGVIANVGVRPDGDQHFDRKAKAPASAYQRMLATLAFLAPDIQAAIVAGRQPVGLKLEHLLRTETPLAWADQRAKYGF